MVRNAVAAVGFAWLVVLAGCGSNPPSNVAIPPESTPPDTDVATPPTDTPSSDVETADETSSPDESIDPADAAANEAQAADPKPRAARERIALLTPGGPLLVDIWFSIDGQPHTEQFDSLVQQVLDAGDADGNGRPTWAAWGENEEFLKGPLANASSDDRQVRTWIEQYDTNKDGAMQKEEVASWLGRGSGHSLRPFMLRSRRSYFAVPALNSRVWQLLDTDRNHRLTAEEIDAMAARMWTLDADDDRIITPPELATLRDQLQAAMPTRSNTSYADLRHAAIHLEPQNNGNRLFFTISDLYAPRHQLSPNSFPDLPNLFATLDTDSNQSLDAKELAQLMTIPPHLELAVTFSKPAKPGESSLRLELRNHATEISIGAAADDQRLRVSLGRTRLIASVHDLGSSPARGPSAQYSSAQRSELRAMIHDDCDALFEELDLNADARLGEREIATGAARLAELDVNDDGVLESEELADYLVVALIRGEALDEQSFYVPPTEATHVVSDQTPAWFAPADFNGDGDVSWREFLGSAEQFQQLDANRDGFVSGDEALEFSSESI